MRFLIVILLTVTAARAQLLTNLPSARAIAYDLAESTRDTNAMVAAASDIVRQATDPYRYRMNCSRMLQDYYLRIGDTNGALTNAVWEIENCQTNSNYLEIRTTLFITRYGRAATNTITRRGNVNWRAFE